MISELGHAPATIPAHAALSPIRIVIFHLEIIPASLVQQHQPVGTYAEPAITELMHLFIGKIIMLTLAIINEDEVVPGALVFMKLYGHVAI
jgi:hypothetical protein